jgi:hypothetical protein
MAGCRPPARTTPTTDPALGHVTPEHVAAGPLRGRTGAYLTVRDAASRVEIRLADLPGLLYRVSTPAEAGLAPQVSGPAGHPKVRLRPTGGDGQDTVTILLNRTVRWAIRVPAGAGEQHLDLRDGRLARIDLGAGGLVDVRLPPARRTVPVTLAGPVGSLVLAAPAGTPVRFRLAGGAGRVAVPWTGRWAAGPGDTVTAPDWGAAADRYAVTARQPITTLTARVDAAP